MKSKSTLLLLPLIMFAVASSLLAQEPLSPLSKHLKDLEAFVGEWEGPYDPPGKMPPGIVHVSCRWMAQRAYLNYKVTFKPNGADFTLNPMNVFVGYSGKTQSLHAWQLGIGSQSSRPATSQKNKVVMQAGEDFSVEGVSRSRTVTFELRSPDEFVSTNTNIMLDGKAQPDEPVLIMKRIK